MQVREGARIGKLTTEITSSYCAPRGARRGMALVSLQEVHKIARFLLHTSSNDMIQTRLESIFLAASIGLFDSTDSSLYKEQ